MGGQGGEMVCMSCVVSLVPGKLDPWLLNAFTGCWKTKEDGTAGKQNLAGEGMAES